MQGRKSINEGLTVIEEETRFLLCCVLPSFLCIVELIKLNERERRISSFKAARARSVPTHTNPRVQGLALSCKHIITITSSGGARCSGLFAMMIEQKVPDSCPVSVSGVVFCHGWECLHGLSADHESCLRGFTDDDDDRTSVSRHGSALGGLDTTRSGGRIRSGSTQAGSASVAFNPIGTERSALGFSLTAGLTQDRFCSL